MGDGSSQVLINAVSLTTPAVSRVFLGFFILLITEFAHTSPLTQEACPFRSCLLTCGTLTCSVRFRSSIQCCPTSISSITNHDELFELPLLQGRRVGFRPRTLNLRPLRFLMVITKRSPFRSAIDLPGHWWWTPSTERDSPVMFPTPCLCRGVQERK